MKRILFSLSAFIALFFFVTSLSFAQTVEGGKREQLNISKERIVNGDYFAAGPQITIFGTVNGDTYIAGGNVTFDGVVNGDLLVAGGNVKIFGVVHGNVRTAGGNVQIRGVVDKNVTALGGTIDIDRDAKVLGSLTAAGGTISVDSNLGKGLTAAGGNLTIRSKVNGNVTVAVGKLNLNSAQISGDLTYLSKNELVKSEDSTVLGKITHNLPSQRKQNVPGREGAKLGFVIYRFFVSLIFGAIFLYFFPRFSRKIADRISSKFVSSLLWGFLLMIVWPIIAVILLVTIVGIPFALILFFAYLLLLLFGYIFSGIAIGNWLGDRFNFSKNPYLLMAVGLLVLGLIRIIPIVGALVGFVATLAGFGAYILTKKEFFLELRGKKLL